ncbi:MAG: aminoglycoside phosphotransferase family protein [Burkholderiales bacterium]
MSAEVKLPTDRADRFDLMRQWLQARRPDGRHEFQPASSDASFRRYFRVTDETGATAILMDAPPELENCEPFVRIARLFGDAGIHVPRVIEQDLASGFLLLSDMGATTYLSELLVSRNRIDGQSQIDLLYRDAIQSLCTLQRASRENALPVYDRALLERELRLFPDWYVDRQLAAPLSAAQVQDMQSTFDVLLANNLAQARVFVHRDYHSRNLMVCQPNPGILDFQDAVYGPITYDLVSLLRDAYIEWEEERVIDWCVRYWELARKAALPVPADFGDFYRDFEWMGVQRQIKVVGIFARLAIRDGKSAYLEDQPLVLRYLRAACRRYRELSRFAVLLDQLEATASRAES